MPITNHFGLERVLIVMFVPALVITILVALALQRFEVYQVAPFLAVLMLIFWFATDHYGKRIFRRKNS